MVEHLPKILPPGHCVGCGASCRTMFCDGCAPPLPGARFPMPDRMAGSHELARARHRRRGALRRNHHRPHHREIPNR
jgi:hypothetical protein